MLQNTFQNAINIREYLSIVKTKYFYSGLCKDTITLSISMETISSEMLSTVNFNNELSGRAVEVNDILSERRLALRRCHRNISVSVDRFLSDFANLVKFTPSP